MALLDRVEKAQKAVYWPPKGRGSDGRPKFGPPVEIGCYWQDVTELFLDNTGAEQISKSKVIVDRDLEVGGMLRLGDMDSVPYPPDPRQNDNVHVIRSFSKRPANIRATKFLKKVML
jgi:hypothetical protein